MSEVRAPKIPLHDSVISRVILQCDDLISFLYFPLDYEQGLLFFFFPLSNTTGLPGSLDGKESACNVGDPSSIPGLGRSPEEGISCPLQYSWAYLVSQIVKNLPAMQETWVRSLGWDGRAWQPTPVFFPGESPWTEEPGGLQSMGSQSPTGLSD